jgi:NTP pyrophosphatase (non-canonical NTP hydrolase)
MSQLNLTELQDQLNRFSKERDWDQFHTVKNLLMALSVEVSELVEIFQWLTPDEAGEIKNNPELKLKAQEEVADVFIYLMRVISKLEIDLPHAIEDKMKKNALKYPVELSKGLATKYTELKSSK